MSLQEILITWLVFGLSGIFLIWFLLSHLKKRKTEQEKKQKIQKALREAKEPLPFETLHEIRKYLEEKKEQMDKKEYEDYSRRISMLRMKCVDIHGSWKNNAVNFECKGEVPEGVAIANLRISAIQLKIEAECLQKDLHTAINKERV